MSKTQTIVGLLLFLVILFSMNMIFGNILRETFIANNKNIGMPSDVQKLNYKLPARVNTLNGNIIYSGKGFLGGVAPQTQNDDQPLFFGFFL